MPRAHPASPGPTLRIDAARHALRTVLYCASWCVSCCAWLLATLTIWIRPAVAAPSPEAVEITSLDVEDGLSHSVVYTLLRDRRGFVWIGTEDGLDRYDGTRFEHIHHLGAVQAGTHWDVSSMVEEPGGTLWIGTWGGGLKRIEPATGRVTAFRHDVSDPGSLADDRVQQLHLDATGTLWIGTYDGLDRLVRSEDGPVRFVHHHTTPDGLSSDRVWSIAGGADENVLFVGTESGLDRFDLRTGRAETIPLARQVVRAVHADHHGRVWAGTPDGLLLVDPASSDPPRTLLTGVTVNVLAGRDDGSVWVGTQANGLFLVDPDAESAHEQVVRLRTEVSAQPSSLRRLDLADVRALIEDDLGLLWVATRGGGVQVVHLGPRAVRSVPLLTGDAAVDADPRAWIVTAVEVDAEERAVWAGTGRGLVRVRNPESSAPRVERFRHDPADPASLVDDSVSVLHRSVNGDLWVGTWRGLDRAVIGENRASKTVSFARALAHDAADGVGGSPLRGRIEALADGVGAQAGRLWVGTHGGLGLFDPATGEAQFWSHDPKDHGSLADDLVLDVEVEPDGAVWVGTDAGGLARFDPADGTFRAVRHDPNDPASIGHDRIFEIWREPGSGALWLATAFGVDRFDPVTGVARRYGIDEGLPSATAKCIVGQGKGTDGAVERLWISSNGGLTRLEPATGLVRNYGRGDGLGGLLYLAGACNLGVAGEGAAGEGAAGVYFGSRHGLERLDPEAGAGTAATPPLVLTGLTVAGEPYAGERPAAGDESTTPTQVPLEPLGASASASGSPGRLDLDWTERTFAFEFAALDYRAPRQVRYSFVLEGFDPGWTEAVSRRYASYTNVPPGDYTFRVRATDSLGRPVRPELAIPVVVTPPFWQTPWFRALAVGVLGLVLLGGHRLRLRHLRRQKKELEERVREQTTTLRRQRRRLEMIDRIVQLINAEEDLGRLLCTILEGLSFAEAADRGIALVRTRGRNGARGGFAVRATTGWVGADDEGPRVEGLGIDDIEQRYLGSCEVLAEGIWLGSPGPSDLRRAEEACGPVARQVLALRVEVDGEAEGYLLLAKTNDDADFARVDVAELANLKHHAESAFRKARMLDELRWLNAKKSEFLGIAAHDLRSPLGSIQSYADLLIRWLDQDRFDPDRGRRFLGHVRSAAAHMLGLINELLDVTAIETGRLELRPETIDLAEVVEERRNLHERVALDKDIELTTDLGEGPSWVEADRLHTAEVVDNLLSNALKFTPRGGRVTLRLERRGSAVVTHVADTGQGLAEDEVTQAFSGRKLSARPTGGEASTGLGLVIVKKIVEMQDGAVWAESRRGEGSTFSFSLPSAPAPPRVPSRDSSLASATEDELETPDPAETVS